MTVELVRRAREARGLTQTDLASATGLSQTYISQVERGDISLPRDHNLDKLGKPLGLARADFYRAAGMFEGLDAAQPPAADLGTLPVPRPHQPDAPFDPWQIVAYVESKPDPPFQAQLARQKARRTQQSYLWLCLRIYRAWTSNADLAMDAGEALEPLAN